MVLLRAALKHPGDVSWSLIWRPDMGLYSIQYDAFARYPSQIYAGFV